MPNKAQIDFELGGITDLAPFIGSLKPSTQSRVLGRSMELACRPIERLAKAKVPRETGALAKAITTVVRRYPEKGYIAGYIGAARGYYSSGKRGARRVKAGETVPQKRRSPANYSHLVEFGTRHSTPRPFLRPAVENGRPAADAALAAGFAAAIEAENRKAARKFGRGSSLKAS